MPGEVYNPPPFSLFDENMNCLEKSWYFAFLLTVNGNRNVYIVLLDKKDHTSKHAIVEFQDNYWDPSIDKYYYPKVVNMTKERYYKEYSENFIYLKREPYYINPFMNYKILE